MPSFREAAIIILKEAGTPLTVSEITKRSLQKGLINTNGKTPKRTMYTQIYRDIEKKKKDSAFIKSGKGFFKLNHNKI